MSSRQEMKADARKSAEDAPKSDPETAAKALAEAKGGDAAKQQPVYKTQTDDIAGENIHRDKSDVISEFDAPAENTVKS